MASSTGLNVAVVVAIVAEAIDRGAGEMALKGRGTSVAFGCVGAGGTTMVAGGTDRGRAVIIVGVSTGTGGSTHASIPAIETGHAVTAGGSIAYCTGIVASRTYGDSSLVVELVAGTRIARKGPEMG